MKPKSAKERKPVRVVAIRRTQLLDVLTDYLTIKWQTASAIADEDEYERYVDTNCKRLSYAEDLRKRVKGRESRKLTCHTAS